MCFLILSGERNQLSLFLYIQGDISEPFQDTSHSAGLPLWGGRDGEANGIRP